MLNMSIDKSAGGCFRQSLHIRRCNMKKICMMFVAAALLLAMYSVPALATSAVNAPAHVEEIYYSNTGKTIITVDASVEIPQAESIPVYAVDVGLFTMEEIERFAQVCFDGDAHTEPPSDISILLEYEAPHNSYTITGSREYLNGKKAKLNIYTYFDHDSQPFFTRLFYQEPCEAYYSYPIEHSPGATDELLRQKAISIAKAIHPDFDLAYEEPARDMMSETEQTGSRFCFTKTISGVSTACTGEDCASYDNLQDTYNRKYPYEKLIIVFDHASGAKLVFWECPYTVTETLTDSAPLLSFDQIMEIASRLLPIKYAHQEKYLEYRNQQTYCKTTNRITLSYTRIQSKDNPKQFQLVPVWDFFDAEAPDSSMLTLNAIDGTAIDRGYGY